MATSAITALATITLGSGQSTVTFSSISSSFRDLRIVSNLGMSAYSAVWMQINGDTTTKYNRQAMSGNGASAVAQLSTAANQVVLNSSQTYSNAFESNLIIDFLDYAAGNKHKVGLYRRNTVSGEAEAGTWRWASTAAITSITIYSSTSTFMAGTVFTLYGVTS